MVPLNLSQICKGNYVNNTFFSEFPMHSKFQNYLSVKHITLSPFLDVFLRRVENRLQTAVYRKPIFTGLGLMNLSFIPQLFKVNSFIKLLFRYFVI